MVIPHHDTQSIRCIGLQAAQLYPGMARDFSRPFGWIFQSIEGFEKSQFLSWFLFLVASMFMILWMCMKIYVCYGLYWAWISPSSPENRTGWQVFEIIFSTIEHAHPKSTPAGVFWGICFCLNGSENIELRHCCLTSQENAIDCPTKLFLPRFCKPHHWGHIWPKLQCIWYVIFIIIFSLLLKFDIYLYIYIHTYVRIHTYHVHIPGGRHLQCRAIVSFCSVP